MKITIRSTSSLGPPGGGAPINASYITLAANSTLTAERRLVAGSGINITDNGPNGTVVIGSTGGGAIQWNELSPSARLNTTASLAIAGGLGSNYAAQSAGTDVFFFASGSIGAGDKSVFGGDVVISGSLTGKNGIDISGNNMKMTGTLSVVGSMNVTGTLGMMGSIIPDQDTMYTLGTSAKRWSHVYTGDLHLRNERGDWTIVEEHDYLCVVNNITGKKYKMMLQPIDEEI
jgi:hypothetical protein